MYSLTLDNNERRKLVDVLNAMRDDIIANDLPSDKVDAMLGRIAYAAPHRSPRHFFKKRYIVVFDSLEKKLMADALYEKRMTSDTDTEIISGLLNNLLAAKSKED